MYDTLTCTIRNIFVYVFQYIYWISFTVRLDTNFVFFKKTSVHILFIMVMATVLALAVLLWELRDLQNRLHAAADPLKHHVDVPLCHLCFDDVISAFCRFFLNMCAEECNKLDYIHAQRHHGRNVGVFIRFIIMT